MQPKPYLQYPLNLISGHAYFGNGGSYYFRGATPETLQPFPKHSYCWENNKRAGRRSIPKPRFFTKPSRKTLTAIRLYVKCLFEGAVPVRSMFSTRKRATPILARVPTWFVNRCPVYRKKDPMTLAPNRTTSGRFGSWQCIQSKPYTFQIDRSIVLTQRKATVQHTKYIWTIYETQKIPTPTRLSEHDTGIRISAICCIRRHARNRHDSDGCQGRSSTYLIRRDPHANGGTSLTTYHEGSFSTKSKYAHILQKSAWRRPKSATMWSLSINQDSVLDK